MLKSIRAAVWRFVTQIPRRLKIGVAVALKFALDISIAVLAVALLFGILPTQVVDPTDLPDLQSLWWVLGVVLFIRTAIVSRLSRQLRKRAWNRLFGPKDEVTPVASEDFVRFAEDTFGSRFASTTEGARLIPDLAASLMDLSGSFDRIKESVEIGTSRYKKTTNLTFRPPRKGLCLVPLLAQRKRILVDELEFSVGSAPGSTLSFVENQGTLLVLIDTLFQSTFVQPEDHADLLMDIKCAVAADHPTTTKVLANRLDHLAHKVSPAGQALHSFLKSLVEFGGDHYLIFACVEAPERATPVRITLCSTYERLPSGSFVPAVRRALGLYDRVHSFWFDRAYETPSYHFQVKTPKGMYVHESVSLVGLKGRGKAKSASSTLPGGIAQARSAVPDQNASDSAKLVHLYLRDQSPPARSAIHGRRLNLRERPPGLLEVSLLLSAGLFAMTWLVGMKHDDIFTVEPGGQGPGSGFTLLFGVPTLLSGWLISRLDASALSRVSFISVGMIGWLFVNSAAAVTAAVFKASSTATLSDGSVGPIDYIGTIDHPVWAGVTASCALHLFSLVFLCCARAVRYWATISRVTDNNVKEYDVHYR